MNTTFFKFLPDREVALPIGWLIIIGMALVSLGVAYGGYRIQASDVTVLKQEMMDIRLEMVKLEQSLADVKASLDRR